MSNFDPHRYTITIKLVTIEEGKYFEALVAELPDLVEYGETFDQAYSLAIDSITTLNEATLEQGRVFPEPMPSQALEEFSGRVTLRMSKSLHASVSKLADREGVSLNSWIVEAMSARAGAGFSAWAVERVGRADTDRMFNEGFFHASKRLGGEAISTCASARYAILATAHARYGESSRSANVMPEQITGDLFWHTTSNSPIPLVDESFITRMECSTKICPVETMPLMLMTTQ